MGKSRNRKNKASVNQNPVPVPNKDNKASPVVNNGVEPDPSIFLKRAHELKEEGNKRFQSKDYIGALQQYENALKLIPKIHPERAVFHSNRAACLMQMKPIDYETVVSECTLALQVQPGFSRALLRRARAFEATGKYESAMQDVQVLLNTEPNHKDALDLAGRLRLALAPAQQDLQSRPSPAALGASAALGAPIAGLGPCLPARPVSKKVTPTPPSPSTVPSSTVSSSTIPSSTVPSSNSGTNKGSVSVSTVLSNENGVENKTQLPKVVLKPSNGSTKSNPVKENRKEEMGNSSKSIITPSIQVPIQYRPLKLVYDHDIRLAQMPINCKFKVLREIISTRFPMSKHVLIKYQDIDNDLITITSTSELKLAESSINNEKSDSLATLKLHIVEVGPEYEPIILDEEEEVEEEVKLVDSSNIETEKKEDLESKEVEMDDWLFEFAQLFRTHVGIDSDAHIELHELGMELCSEALEETVTSEEAQILFDKAAFKFQEVAALAFFNWGNVHMCAARKRIPIDDSASQEIMASQLQIAYDWVKEKYVKAKEKYEEALSIKPDFYEGLLALGQQQFEMAKLDWSFVIAKKEDLKKWDPVETLGLFNSAEEKMKLATEMWEKLEELRGNEVGNDLKRKVGPTNDEGVEQAVVMRSQIHLFWGNMLFERSQVECKLGLDGWVKNLETAVERFKLAGASEVDIATVLKNHCSNEEKVESNVEVVMNE